jgi:hypothetical protein
MFVRMEWLIFELAVLGWAVYELWSIRRTIRRDREAAAAATKPKDGHSG